MLNGLHACSELPRSTNVKKLVGACVARDRGEDSKALFMVRPLAKRIAAARLRDVITSFPVAHRQKNLRGTTTPSRAATGSWASPTPMPKHQDSLWPTRFDKKLRWRNEMGATLNHLLFRIPLKERLARITTLTGALILPSLTCKVQLPQVQAPNNVMFCSPRPFLKPSRADR